MTSILQNIIRGISYFLDGVSLMLHPSLRKYIWLPLLVNVLFYIVLFIMLYQTLYHYSHVLAAWTPNAPSWLLFFGVLLFKFLFGIFFVFGMSYSFFIMAIIIASPFNGMLAERTASLLEHIVPTLTYKEMMCDLPRLIGRQLLIVLIYVPLLLLLNILLWIPVLSIIILPISYWYHAKFMALIYLDYPADNQRVSLRDLRLWMREHRVMLFGFGGTVFFCSMVPVLNFFVIPASVVAATKIWVDRYPHALQQGVRLP